MNRARWYSSATVLPNAEVYIQGGSGGHDRPEVRQLDGSFRLLSGIDTSTLQSLYPRNFIAPDGRIFGYDTNGVMYYMNPSGTGQRTNAGQFSSAYAGWTSGAAMFRPGRILQMGGNSNGAVVIDITSGAPVVTPTQPMSTRRQWVSATVLPDGRVVATGGSSVENQMTGVNNSAEIWNPTTGQWTLGPSGARARLYHSVALLLPDASVLVAGGGAPGPLNNLHAEIYYPPYLYDSSGDFASRPVISTAPDIIDLGQNFQVGVGAADIRRVTLIRTGSVTHSVNMDQRFLELTFTASSGTLFVQAPASAADAPPGYYLLFALDARGVPSVGKIIRINVPSAPVVSLDYTPTIGGAGGNPFALSCNADETVVGVHGNSDGTHVTKVGVQCVSVDTNGRWIGDPVNRSMAGGGGGTVGPEYARTCPRDFALSGFRGRAGQYINQLDFECRALTPQGRLSGAGQFLGAVGGTGGTATGPYACSTGNPVSRLTGRAGWWLDAFGMECAQAPITSTESNAPPVVTNPGSQLSTLGMAVALQINASDPDGDTLSYSATGLPAGLAISGSSGLISGTPTTAGTTNPTVTVSDGSSSTTASFSWTVNDADPLVLDPMPKQPARLVNTAVTYTASTRNGINPQYRWYFDDGTETGWSSSPTIEHTFTKPTIYWVSVTARDDRGIEQTQTFSQLIHNPLTTQSPAASSNIARAAGRLWVVNQDNNSVSVFDLTSNTGLAQVPVGNAPRAVAIAPDGRIWVTNKKSATISVIDPVSLSVSQTVNLPYGSQPYGIVFPPGAGSAYVALEAAGRVLRLDAVSGAELGAASVGPSARHLSISADGTRLYVSRFVTPRLPGEGTQVVTTSSGPTQFGGELLVLDAATLGTVSVVVLRHSDDLDFENAGSGVPNYLGPAVISPDGLSAWVPSKKDNVKRGMLRSGGHLNHQNTVRAISSRIDLLANAETFGARVDHDNASLASAVAFDRHGVFLFVALETSREVAVVDANNNAEFFRIQVGRAPQGLAISADGYRLYVNNFMDRTVSVFDLTKLIDEGQWDVPLLATLETVTTEALDATILKGKQFFYDARDTRLAREGYMSCASCHNDGGGDGRVWDMTGFGEGLRNTIALNGRGGLAHGSPHWSANFDEIQDFEGQIRSLAGGTGLMANADFTAGTRSLPLGDPKAGLSADLDALAAYVASLNVFAASPFRNADGSLTGDGLAGREIFTSLGCATCHGGPNFSDSGAGTLHDVGTIKQPTSGQRLGASLTGLDVPTLRDVWATAPYLHDGSAGTLEEAVRAHEGVSIADTDLAMLVAYLKQIDGSEPAPAPPAPANTPPVVTNPGAQGGTVGTALSLTIAATDADGDPLSFTATGLPAGLTLAAASGVISGTPTTAGASTVVVSASDGRGGTGSTTFGWTITAANTPPVVTNPGAQGGTVGTALSLTIAATDADGDPLSFTATGLPAGLTLAAASGVISGTPTTAGASTVVVSASDGRGGTGSTTFGWTITAANTPPVVTNPGAQGGTVGTALSLTIAATDADGDPLSFTATGLPAGLTLAAASGVISGTPTTAGASTVVVSASDGRGGTGSTTFGWTITAANTPPVVTNPGAQGGTVGTALSLTIAATDADGDPLSFSGDRPAGRPHPRGRQRRDQRHPDHRRREHRGGERQRRPRRHRQHHVWLDDHRGQHRAGGDQPRRPGRHGGHGAEPDDRGQ
jgi:large repetitive protein